jgi:DNA polymerase III alpha subunit
MKESIRAARVGTATDSDRNGIKPVGVFEVFSWNPYQHLRLMSILVWQYGFRRLARRFACRSLHAAKVSDGDILTANMVVAKQKPPTAKGFAFFMLEDGSARAQLTISLQLWAKHREILQQARMLITQACLLPKPAYYPSLCQQARASIVTTSRAARDEVALEAVAALLPDVLG